MRIVISLKRKNNTMTGIIKGCGIVLLKIPIKKTLTEHDMCRPPCFALLCGSRTFFNYFMGVCIFNFLKPTFYSPLCQCVSIWWYFLICITHLEWTHCQYNGSLLLPCAQTWKTKEEKHVVSSKWEKSVVQSDTVCLTKLSKAACCLDAGLGIGGYSGYLQWLKTWC